MTRTSTTALLLAPALLCLAPGCGSLGVTLNGTVRTPLVEPACSAADEPAVLSFDRLGNLTLNGQVLDLPAAREQERLLVKVVDAGALPPVWRPRHALDGGVLVASLHKASPLAIAGLRPFDRVRAVNGAAVRSPEDCVVRLGLPEGEALALDVTRADGREATLRAVVGERVEDASKVYVPFLFDRRASTVGTAFGFAPFDALFWYRAKTDHRYVKDEDVGHSAYEDRFEWGALANLIYYERREDLRTGKQESRLRLLWFLSLGDDL